MPIYEYRCQDCRDEIEVQQSFSDDALTTCPTCGGTLKKKFSSVGISFKGSGFYKTDSRSSSSSSPAKKDSGDKDKSDSSPSTATSSSDSSSKSDSPAKKSDSTSTSSTPAAASA
jgi:putative FmdB family regulatory protein